VEALRAGATSYGPGYVPGFVAGCGGIAQIRDQRILPPPNNKKGRPLGRPLFTI